MMIALVAFLAHDVAASSPQGYGAATSGGAGKTIVHVRNLNDSGAGSFREAVSQGNRTVVFDVAGTINLLSPLSVRGAYITIDGSSAPSPGITIRQAGIRLDGSGVHDVILSGLRVRNPGVNDTGGDGIMIKNGAYNLVIDHVSVDGCGDGNIDITRGVHDVTIQWSVLSGCTKNMLIKYEAKRVSVHHNVFVDGQWRNPNIAYTDEFTSNVSPDTTVDFRNNLVWHWGDSGGGTILQCGAKTNLVNNYYCSPSTTASRQANAIVDDGCSVGSAALVYAAGNFSADDLSFDLNRVSNQSRPFAATAVDTTDACVGAHDALAGAGVDPLDTIDRQHLGAIALGACAGTPPPVVDLMAQPALIGAGESSILSWSASNATSCTASGGWSGPKPTSGSQSIAPPVSTTYALNCTGVGGTGSASVTVSVDPRATPFSQYYEAENGVVILPMSTGDDSTALGGECVTTMTGGATTSPSAETMLSATMPSAGTYYLWARVLGPDPASDALYAGIDSSWDRLYPARPGDWEWVRVENGMNTGAFGFLLTAGSHTLKAGHGELNARLDAFYVTTDPNDVPAAAPLPSTATPTRTPTLAPTPTRTPTLAPTPTRTPTWAVPPTATPTPTTTTRTPTPTATIVAREEPTPPIASTPAPAPTATPLPEKNRRKKRRCALRLGDASLPGGADAVDGHGSRRCRKRRSADYGSAVVSSAGSRTE